MLPLTDVLSQLHDAQDFGIGWSAKCPAHDDSGVSLHVEDCGNGMAKLTCRAGCPTHEIEAALWLDAAEEVSEPDEKVGEQLGPVLIPFSAISDVEVDWYWDGHIPSGLISLVVGRPGVGKSTFIADIAARTSIGNSFPDGAPCSQGSVIIVNFEDDPRTTRKRLHAQGADLERVLLLSAVRRPGRGKVVEELISLMHVEDIRQALQKRPDCRLLVLDPIGSLLGSEADMNKENQVRAILTPIAKLAAEFNISVLIVAHPRKGEADYADDLVMGSRAFTGLARAVLHVMEDPDDKQRRLLLAGKCNLCSPPEGLAFRVEGKPSRLQWETEPVDMSADDVLALTKQRKQKPRGPKPNARNDAKEWLRCELQDGPRPATEVPTAWDKLGGSERTLNRAKDDLGVVSFRVGRDWFWRLANKDANPPEEGLPDNLGNLDDAAGNTEASTAAEPADPAAAEWCEEVLAEV